MHLPPITDETCTGRIAKVFEELAILNFMENISVNALVDSYVNPFT